MGSGKLLKRAIKKYGIENFSKEYLGYFTDERLLGIAERILVVLDEEVSYNLCPGGKGGWGYLNDGSPKHIARAIRASQKAIKKAPSWLGKKHSEETKAKMSKTNREIRTWVGRKHSEDSKIKMRKNHNSRSHPIGVKRGPYKRKVHAEFL